MSSHIVFGSQGAGTDDDVLIEILASRTGEQVKDIVKVYKKGELLSCERQTTADKNAIRLVVFYCESLKCDK